MLKVDSHKEGAGGGEGHGLVTLPANVPWVHCVCVAAGNKFVSNAVCTCCCADVSFHQAQNLASHSAF